MFLKTLFHEFKISYSHFFFTFRVAIFLTEQLQVHKYYPVRDGRNADALAILYNYIELLRNGIWCEIKMYE